MKNLNTLIIILLLTASGLAGRAQCTASISDPGSICAGESVTLTVSFDTSDNDCDCNDGQINNADLTWTYNNESFNGQGLNLNVTLYSTTTVTVSASANCLGEDPIEAEVTITVNQVPSFDIALSNSSEALCVGNELTFELDGSFPSPITSYDWTGAVGSGSTATVAIASLGSLNVACEVIDENGCTASANEDFEVTQAVVGITQSGNGSYCQGDPFTLNANPNGTADFISCDWTVSTGFNPSGESCSVSISSANPATHDGSWQVSVVDENGCTATNTVSVIVNTAPTVSIQFDANEACVNGDDVGMDVAPSNGSYTLDCGMPNNNPINVFEDTFDPSDSGPGTFCVCYTAQENGCEAQDCAEITVNDVPDVSFTSNPTATCVSGPTVNLGSFVSPPPSQGMGGSFLVNNCYETIVLDPNEPCLTLSNLLTYTFTDNNGCSSNATSSIQIFEELLASAVSDFDVCEGAAAELGVNASGGNQNTYQYSWSPGGGLNNPSLEEPTVLNASETQEYTVTVSDANGCEASSSTLLSVFPQPAISDIIQNPVSFCVGGSAELNLENNWTSNAWGINTTYNWIFNGNSIQTAGPSNEFDPIMDTTVVSIQVNFSINGYDPGCENIFANYTLNPVPDPAPVLTTEQSSLCSGEEALFTASNTTNGTAFNWEFSPPPSSLEILGNGNVALAAWEGQSGSVLVSVTESLETCAGEDNLSVSLNSEAAPIAAEISPLGNNTLVYTDSGPDCYRWGTISADGVIAYLTNPFTNEAETFQTLVLNEINPSLLYFCEAWFGDCNTVGCSTTAVYDAAFVGVSETDFDSPFTLYPNPSAGQLWLRLPQGASPDLRIEVSNSIGQLIHSAKLNDMQGSQLIPVNLAHLASNLYLVSLYDGSGLIGTTRIIIHR